MWVLLLFQGDEKLPVITNRSERETGFTHEKAKPLYVNRVMPDVSTQCQTVSCIYFLVVFSHFEIEKNVCEQSGNFV